MEESDPVPALKVEGSCVFCKCGALTEMLVPPGLARLSDLKISSIQCSGCGRMVKVPDPPKDMPW